MIIEILLTFIIFATFIVVHELGHAQFIKHYTGESHEIAFHKGDFVQSVDMLDNSQTKKTIWAGILAGLIPLLVSFYILPAIPFAILVLGYFVGIRHDLTMLDKIRNKEI